MIASVLQGRRGVVTLDGHIHVMGTNVEQGVLREAMSCSGVDGGILISLAPGGFFPKGPSLANHERLEALFAWTAAAPLLFPFYWINPTEEDAAEQVDRAVSRGVAGFKIICDRFFPGDERAMRIYARIAAAGRPILFHSGILWDGKASSRFNRPAEFEALLDVDGLRFSLAHISWPWCDELIAVYGKFADAYSLRPSCSVELFIDTTPGTPRLYRREALTKLMTVGYDVGRNIFFGSDCHAHAYNATSTRDWLKLDRSILVELGTPESVMEGIFGGNLRRFVSAGVPRGCRQGGA